jgi:integrase
MPKHTSITDAAAKRLTANGDREDHFDSSHPGLALRVSKSGVKSWVFFYRLVNGHVVQRRMTLGNYPAMSVAEAHEAWRKARDLVAAGRDPQAVADDALPIKSFVSVFEEWMKLDMAGKKSASVIEKRLRTYVMPAWEGRLIIDIDRRAAMAVIDGIRVSGKVVLANRIHAHLHRLFVWCVGRGIIETNPLLHAEKTQEMERERVLSDDEIKKLWVASVKLQPAYRDAFRVLLLTGARKQEISELRWDEIEGDEAHLSGKRTKTGKDHIIPLTSLVREIINAIAKGEGGYVFAPSGFGFISNWDRSKKKLDAKSGVTGWVIHDLRRTLATGLQRLGVGITVTEAVLGHTGGTRGGIVKVYQKYNYLPEKRAALEAWGAHVMALVHGDKRGEVVPLRRA